MVKGKGLDLGAEPPHIMSHPPTPLPPLEFTGGPLAILPQTNLYLRIPHNTLCMHKLLFSNAPRRTIYSGAGRKGNKKKVLNRGIWILILH